jgi:L-lactate dehydrogenase complex protein LldG
MSEQDARSAARRDAVYASIRRSLGVRGNENVRKVIVDGRLINRPKGSVPKRGQLVHFKRTDLFIEMAKAVQATFKRVERAEQVLPAVGEYLRLNNLPARLVHGADPYIKALGWDENKQIEAREGRAQGDDAVSLTKAFAAVAESGTLVMLSGVNNPVTLSFLPDTAIVIVEARDIAGDYESVWARVRETLGDTKMPRTVNWVTGPSRSADIEQTMLLGAHGPRRLHIIVVG